MAVTFPFDNSYARLPERFYTRTPPTPVREPRLIRLNRDLACRLRLDPAALSTREAAELFAGNRVPRHAEPIATAYAGHQFGTFVPQLGDGRAVLLGEVTDRDGNRRDIQLKGAGRTPFSRGGDGRAAVGPVLREYIVSEAMAALGIPTTRALAAVTTGEQVIREEVLPGAVLTRVAASHIRVGTFQYFACRGDTEAVRILADYVIGRHYPDTAGAERPYRALFDAITAAQADLIAGWLLIGFIHGVMNTDNMSVAGETLDYGPCAFMDAYNPATVFSAIDVWGRYAYNRQPAIGEWNLARLAECLLPLFPGDIDTATAAAHDALAAYGPRLNSAYTAGMRRKIGLLTERPGDDELVRRLLQTMTDNAADFTLTFRRLCNTAESGDVTQLRELFIDTAAIDAWTADWRTRLEAEPLPAAGTAAAMRRVNPAVIPRNHQVERVIRAAVESDDFAPFHSLVEATGHPYEERDGSAAYMAPPQPHERVQQTFCGT
jgi:uncharacterized protein YdiU (UPF0061 family)